MKFFKINKNYQPAILNLKIFIFILLFYIIIFSSLMAQDKQYILKAAFLERFTRLIDWPLESGIEDTTKPFIIGVVGENPFGSILENLAIIQKIKNKKIEIKYYTNQNLDAICHLVFISKSEQDNLGKIISIIKNRPILSVGDTKGFANQGVIINLFFDKNKLSYEINESVLNRSRLTASYLLLMTAKIIHQNNTHN
jgi:hypothetical protein